MAANIGVLSTLATKEDVIICDRRDHVTIFMGATLSGATVRTFRHNDVDSFRRLIERTDDGSFKQIFVVTEGLYSADGDAALLGQIVPIAKDHHAVVVVDEAHSFALRGPRGLGIADEQGVYSEVDVVVGTFSKALGSTGGFVLCGQEAREQLQYFAGSYTSSRGLAPAVAGAALAAVDLVIAEGRQLRETLNSNVEYVMKSLRQSGVDTGKTVSHIIPVMVGDEQATVDLARFMLEHGVFGAVFVYPHVPRRQGRIRFGITAAHTRSDLDTLIESLSAASVSGLLPTS